MTALPAPDLAALLWFFGLWAGYTLFADTARRGRSLSAVMNIYRSGWMTRLTEREWRINDSTLVGHLMHSVSFLAQTTLFILAGLVAALGAADKATGLLMEMPFTASVSKELYEIKVLTLSLIFIYAFFKFTWSLRQFNYCCVLMGSAPEPTAPQDEKTAFARRATRLNELAANSFNRGLRAYYFALATLAWFLHPWAYMAATSWVVLVLYRREFRSHTLKALQAG